MCVETSLAKRDCTTPHWLSSFGGSRKDVLPIIIQYIVSLLFYLPSLSLSYCSTWTREMYSSLDNNTRWWRCVCLAAAARIPKRMRNVDQLDIIPACCVCCFSTHFFFFVFLFFFCIFYLFCFLCFHSAVLTQTREMLRWTSWRVCMFPQHTRRRIKRQQPARTADQPNMASVPDLLFLTPLQLRLLTNKTATTTTTKEKVGPLLPQ